MLLLDGIWIVQVHTDLQIAGHGPALAMEPAGWPSQLSAVILMSGELNPCLSEQEIKYSPREPHCF